MSFRGCDMVYHPSDEGAAMLQWPVGHFYWDVDDTDGERYLCMKLPTQDGNPKGSYCSIPVKVGAKEDGYWQWDANVECPTIQPSIFVMKDRPDSPHHWHGWVTAGKMVPA